MSVREELPVPPIVCARTRLGATIVSVMMAIAWRMAPANVSY